MPLELGTRLILRSAADGSPLAPEALKPLVAAWAETPQAAGEDVTDAIGRSGGLVSARTTVTDRRVQWELRLRRADDGEPSVTWTAAVTTLFEPDRTTFVTRLRRDATDHRLRPLVGTAQPPAVIRNILGTETVACFDGPVRVEPRYRTLSAEDVAGFVELVLGADDVDDRQHPWASGSGVDQRV